MVFNGGINENILFLFLFLWTLALTVLVVRMARHYNKLSHGATKVGLREILESLLANQESLKQHVHAIEKGLGETQEEGKFHIQRIGVVRFNPFSDTGGSQSFTISILDKKANGIVMTSLYARTGNRWYIKEVREGKGKDLELSKEELSAIKKALGTT